MLQDGAEVSAVVKDVAHHLHLGVVSVPSLRELRVRQQVRLYPQLIIVVSHEASASSSASSSLERELNLLDGVVEHSALDEEGLAEVRWGHILPIVFQNKIIFQLLLIFFLLLLLKLFLVPLVSPLDGVLLVEED